METQEAFGMVLFFSIFEVLGGAALGAGLRSLVTRNFAGMFFLIWGAGFGGIPLMIGSAVVLFNLRAGVSVGLVIGGFFALLGAFLLLRTAIRVLRSL